MNGLTGRFPAFFEELHGHPPFPWQARLAARLEAGLGWPAVLDLPTGTGKTSAIDIALFALAHDAARDPAERTAPRRIVLVVDRRVIVDQAFQHASTVCQRLASARRGVSHEVARGLRSHFAGSDVDPPISVSVLRGGISRDDAWVERPDQPAVVVSTVDQVGSRLLFRGYGVSDRMAPVHAGLLGNDTLVLLDEVHLSRPFAETLAAISRTTAFSDDAALPSRRVFVAMSATPGARPAGDCFALDAEDLVDPVLARRIQARKPTRMEIVKVSARGGEAAAREAVASAAVEGAKRLLSEGAGAIGIVVNRVDTARRARRIVDAELPGSDTVLLTGRMRPLDRDALILRLWDRIRAGRARAEGERPVVVVATQCIEAGADIDFDGLVAECASLDALRQRFGRLDRRGERDGSRGVVVARSDQIADGAVDPVYGAALAATWKWLSAHRDGLDMGIAHAPVPGPEVLQDLAAPHHSAPILLPAHLDAWVQTSPRPEPEPDLSLWLHGPQPPDLDVQLVWRADLSEDLLERADAEADLEPLMRLLEASPPCSPEAMSVPIAAVRRWLADGGVDDTADVEGAVADSADETGSDRRRALAWLGEASRLVTAGEVRPGMTLVVPAAYGGIGHGSWDPDATTPVADLGDPARWARTGRATLRLHPSVAATWLPEGAALPPRVPDEEDPDADPEGDLAAWLATLPPDLPAPYPDLVREVRRGRHSIRGPTGDWTLVARRRGARGGGGEVTTEDDRSSYTHVDVFLDEHLDRVGKRAAAYAAAIGLPPRLVGDLALAGSLHDAGKADPRFQQMLLSGSEVLLAMQSRPLAKSARPASDHRARSLARARAGYPPGTRHELLSLAMVERSPRVAEAASDRDLVLHLVSSHHGWCRPFAPPQADAPPAEVRVVLDGYDLSGPTAHGLARIDSGVSDRFWRLVERYGPWGLAWLEAIVRLADHRVSEDEQEARAG